MAVTLRDLNVKKASYLHEKLQMPVGGKLGGNFDLLMPEGKLGLAEGKIDFEIERFSVGDGKQKIRGMLALPRIEAGKLTLEAEVKSGRLTISKLEAKGKDLEVIADGKVQFRDPFKNSLAELSLRFKFTDKYKNKSDITKSLFELMNFDPKMRRAKRPDGFYAWRVTGPIERLNFQPAPITKTPGMRGGFAKPKK